MSQVAAALAAALMGVVEGITEYLPISSTGHLVLTRHWLGLQFHESFDGGLQSGAVLAVVVEYRARFRSLLDVRARSPAGFAGLRGWLWLALTTLPAVVLGLLFHSAIKARLFGPAPIAIALFVGGLAMILLERFLPARPDEGLDSLGWKRALGIGFFQCLAMVPGTSRSMATILGARLMGIGRKTAAEYSFFAAVPVLVLAGIYDLLKGLDTLCPADLLPYAVGLAVSFFVARLAIRFLIRLLARHTLEGFGWYRLAMALLVWFSLPE